ncbi:MAG: hypothetical protein HY718_13540 [Planctomycetes bacterium]|nr:hypothetical protein [Planctomycetota bacterium]
MAGDEMIGQPADPSSSGPGSVDPGAADGVPAAPRKTPWGAVGLIVLLGVGVTAVLAWRGLDKRDERIKSVYLCTNAACGYSESRVPAVGEGLPFACPKCGQKTMYASFACPNCGTKNVLNQDRGLPGPSKCSKCDTELHYGDE